jgi:hypothetical protein
MQRHAPTNHTPAFVKSYLAPIRSEGYPISDMTAEDYSEGRIRSFHSKMICFLPQFSHFLFKESVIALLNEAPKPRT